MNILESWNGLVVEQSDVKILIHPSLGVSNDQNKDLVDQFGQLQLKDRRRFHKTGVLFQIVQQQGRVGDPKGQDRHVPLMLLYHVVDLLHGQLQQVGQQLVTGVVMCVSGAEKQDVGRYRFLRR